MLFVPTGGSSCSGGMAAITGSFRVGGVKRRSGLVAAAVRHGGPAAVRMVRAGIGLANAPAAVHAIDLVGILRLDHAYHPATGLSGGRQSYYVWLTVPGLRAATGAYAPTVPAPRGRRH